VSDSLTISNIQKKRLMLQKPHEQLIIHNKFNRLNLFHFIIFTNFKDGMPIAFTKAENKKIKNIKRRVNEK